MWAWAWTPWGLRSTTGVATAPAYAAWARKDHAEVLTDELPEGAKLHWVGPRREDRIILYFHGAYTIFFFSSSSFVVLNVEDGGLFRRRICFPAREDNFEILAFLQKDCKDAAEIAFLNYCAFF